ncbi:MAG: transposase [Cyanobacteria bacterium J06623_1]
MTSDQTVQVEQLIQDYLAAWNASDSDKRAMLLDQVMTSDCIYADSHLPNLVETQELHGQFIEQFRSKFPELQISLTSTPDTHHGFFRFGWQLAKSTGEIFTTGIFFGEISQEGKISKLVGFV